MRVLFQVGNSRNEKAGPIIYEASTSLLSTKNNTTIGNLKPLILSNTN